MIVTIAIVAKNEEKYLEQLFSDLLSQDFNLSKVELLLIDSKSDDMTMVIMEQFKVNNEENFFDIKVLSNENETQASGWNVAFKEFKGDIISRIDGHSRLDSEFIKNVVYYIESGEDVVGGPRLSIIETDSQWSQILFTSENAMFGSGFASYRKESVENTYKKTMFHASYKKEVIEKTGYFDERLGRTEDNDFHYRIRKNGFKLFYSNQIKSYQYARPTFKKMLKQKFSNGFWIGKTLWIQPKCLSLFHFVPFVFLLALFCSILLSVLSFTNILIRIVMGLYILFCFSSTFIEIMKNKNILYCTLPVIFFSLHISYGMGTFVGLIFGRKGMNSYQRKNDEFY